MKATKSERIERISTGLLVPPDIMRTIGEEYRRELLEEYQIDCPQSTTVGEDDLVFQYTFHKIMWRYITDHDLTDKAVFFFDMRVKHKPSSGCYACDYAKKKASAVSKGTSILRFECDYCPLDWANGNCHGSGYDTWLFSKDVKERRAAAKSIAEVGILQAFLDNPEENYE